MEYADYAKSLIAVLVIVNPLGAIPVFLTLTANYPDQERKNVSKMTAFSVTLVLIISSLIGEKLLKLFGVTIDAFRVGGGILILMMAMGMMHAQPLRSKQTPEEHEEASDRENIAVVPMAIPLLAGPGAISTMIIYAHQTNDWLDFFYLWLVSLSVGLTVFLTLLAANPISHYLGKTGVNIATRLMGLILAAVAVEFIAKGVKKLLF